jgi:hypothetical protein
LWSLRFGDRFVDEHFGGDDDVHDPRCHVHRLAVELAPLVITSASRSAASGAVGSSMPAALQSSGLLMA